MKVPEQASALDAPWNDMQEAHDQGYHEGLTDGARDAAVDLMRKLREGGCRDDDWNGGDVVEMVDTWLQAKGVDTHVYACDECEMGGFDASFNSQAGLDAHNRDEHVEEDDGNELIAGVLYGPDGWEAE